MKVNLTLELDDGTMLGIYKWWLPMEKDPNRVIQAVDDVLRMRFNLKEKLDAYDAARTETDHSTRGTE